MYPTTDQDQQDDTAQAAQLRAFEQETRPPDAIKSLLSAMDEQREFVHTTANLADQPGGVSTNYLWRAQQVHQAKVYAKNPSCSVRARKKLGEMPPGLKQRMDAFAATMDLLIQSQSDEGGFRDVLEGVVQDVDTVGVTFVKLTFIESDGRDPAGVTRPQDAAQTVSAYTALHAEFARGDFTAEDAKYQRLQELADNIRKQHEGELWRQMAFGDGAMPPTEDPRTLRWEGLPTPQQVLELPKFRGFVLDPLDPEDVRWDWVIKRPELLHRGRHIDYRTFMTRDQIRRDYQLPDDDSCYFPGGAKAQRGETPVASQDQDQAKADLDATEKEGTYCVWVREDREANRVYTWVHGAEKPLSVETPEATSRDWFTIYPVYFNRVSGRVVPLSNTSLGRDLQEEINTVRTHKRMAKRAAYNRYLVENDLLDEGEMELLRTCPPEGWVPTKKKVEDIREKIFQINGQFNPAVHDVLEERQELGAILGQSQATQGMAKGGADSATEASIANQTGELMDDKHMSFLERLLQKLYTAMGDILTQVLPEENARAMAGPGAVWPMGDRIAIWNHLEVQIAAGSTGKPDQQKERDAFSQTIELGKAMGIGMPGFPQWNIEWGLRKLAAINDWREDPMDMVIMPPPMLPMMPGTPGGPGPNGPPAAGGPGPRQGANREITDEITAPGANAPESMPEPHMATAAPTPEQLGAPAG